GSALEGKVGKIPSVFDMQGRAMGLRAWTKREIEPEELAEWSKDSRYNICVRTGISGVYALDVDVADPTASKEIEDAIIEVWPEGVSLEWRTRSNSAKFLLPFRMDGAIWKKCL